jgi:flavin-dependent dehydrogenase
VHTIVQKNSSGRPRVVIVGAGISGLTLATLLSDTPVDVLVLRQDMVPSRARWFPGLFSRDDLRSLGITEEGELGLPIGELERSVIPLAGVGRSGDVVPVDFVLADHGVVLGALERRLQVQGVLIFEGVTATGLTMAEGVATGVIDTGRKKNVPADVVVLADESDPRLAEQAGLRPDWLPTELMHLCKEQFPASADFIDERFRNERGTYRAFTFRHQSSWGAWGTGIVLPGKSVIAVQVAMLLEDEMASAKHIKEFLDEFKAHSQVATLLGDLQAEPFFTEVVPIGGFEQPRRFHTDGLLLVNDLLGLTHPLNRDGLSTNLKACAAATIAIGAATREHDFSSRVLSRYSKQLSSEVIRPADAKRRRSPDLRDRPAWQWTAFPSLLPSAEGVTRDAISATLPTSAGRNALRRLTGIGRRVGLRTGSRNVVDE